MGRTALEKLVIRRRAAGVSQSEIAREVGLSRQRISQICKRLGISIPPPAHQQRLANLPALMREGLSIEKIATRLDVSYNCVRCAIQRLPDRDELEKARANARPSIVRRRRIQQFIKSGMAIPGIAGKLDVDVELVRRDMKRDPNLRLLRDVARANQLAADPRAQAVAHRRERVRELAYKGKRPARISETLGIPLRTVVSDLRRMGD